MSIRDAAKLAPLEDIGNDSYQAAKDGIRYDFSVTRLGRIYRIDSEQNLGRFVIDSAFLRSLTTKLTIKYGPTERSSGETFGWSLVELVKRTNGEMLPFVTNWASAYVNNGFDGVTVYVKLLDFRIMWKDEASLNDAPRSKAEERIAL